MSDDVDDVQTGDITLDVRHLFNLLLMLYVHVFSWAWMALRARNASPSGRATFNPQSKCYGPRPGPKRAYGVRAGSLFATERRARGITGGRQNQKCRRVKKTHLYIYIGCLGGEYLKIEQENRLRGMEALQKYNGLQ